MKNMMKQQRKDARRASLFNDARRAYPFKELLLVLALSGFSVAAFAQAAEVCAGTPYTIASTIDASGSSAYQWLENNLVLSSATAANYTVPANKAAGVYTYIRQAKSADCPEWQSSNEFTVTVFACSVTAGTETGSTATFIDPRDGKSYKTVVMPDGRTWFAQNLNYTKDLTFNKYADLANEKNGRYGGPGYYAIGSFWCPGIEESNYSGDLNTCNVYGALYTWETAMMVDGKYTDETKTSSAWDQSWYQSSTTITTSTPFCQNSEDLCINAGRGQRGICPKGWHVPTTCEWAIMLDSVGHTNVHYAGQGGSYNDIASKYLIKQSSGTTPSLTEPVWLSSLTGTSDPYGFSLVPAGYRDQKGPFWRLGKQAVLWSSVIDQVGAGCVARFGPIWESWHYNASHALALRCIQDL
jgi:uncharacterized protein (TIGR02145 family)